ncbi:hypothetical protein B0I72DRAFT_163255 [Yarrowia lipolytica]|nr:hypothetical protein B0I72DRAFT_163255 [Yarrowia lipolytica]
MYYPQRFSSVLTSSCSVLKFCSCSSQFLLCAVVILDVFQVLQHLLLWWLVEFHLRAAPGRFSALFQCCVVGRWLSGSLRLGLVLCSGGLAGWAQTLCSMAVFVDSNAKQAGSGLVRVPAVLLTVIAGVLILSQQQMEGTYDCSNDSPSLQSIQELLSMQGVAPKGATHTVGELLDNVSCPSLLHIHGDRIHEGLAKPPTRHHPASS